MVRKSNIHTILAILIISLLSYNTMAFSLHSNDTISQVSADTIVPTRNKVQRIAPKGSLENNAIVQTPLDTNKQVADTTIAQVADTVEIQNTDSVQKPSTTSVTTAKVKTESALDAVVDFTAQDSLVFEAGNMAFLYGTSVVNYQDIQLDADQIELSLNDNTVFAIGRTDSLGQVTGNPIYKDASGEYESETMSYNFKTKRGYITNVITE